MSEFIHWSPCGGSEESNFFAPLINAANKIDLVGGQKHSAMLVYKNRILSIGTNKRKTHPICVKYQMVKSRFYLHAEMDCIIRGLNRFGHKIVSRSDIYVLRVTKGGKVSYSKPCQACRGLIEGVGIETVYHT